MIVAVSEVCSKSEGKIFQDKLLNVSTYILPIYLLHGAESFLRS